MGSWEQTRKETEGAASGGDFLKLEDGQSAIVALLGDPETYLAKPFEDDASKGPKKRVLLNVFVKESKSLSILDLAAASFNELCETLDKFPRERFLVQVKRKGTGKKTRWSFLPDAELNEAQKKHLATLKLRDLAELAERIRFKGDDETVKKPEAAKTTADAAKKPEPVTAPAGSAAPAERGDAADDDIPF